jgi:hypothetical protein
VGGLADLEMCKILETNWIHIDTEMLDTSIVMHLIFPFSKSYIYVRIVQLSVCKCIQCQSVYYLSDYSIHPSCISASNDPNWYNATVVPNFSTNTVYIIEGVHHYR